MFFEGSEGPFGAFPIFFDLGVFDKLFRMFIATEVSQMDVSLPCVFRLHIVLVCGESSQSLLEHVNPQRVVTSHQHVNPEVVFEIVYQMRIRDILRNEVIFFIPHLGIAGDHFYPSPAGLVRWLHYPQFPFLCSLSGHLEAVVVCWEEIGVGHKVVSFRETTSLFIEMFPHVIFPP